jgi:hypothetical protein
MRSVLTRERLAASSAVDVPGGNLAAMNREVATDPFAPSRWHLGGSHAKRSRGSAAELIGAHERST